MTQDRPERVAPSDIEKNRPGSPFVEMDLEDASAAERIGRYYIDLQRRHARQGGWQQAPELGPLQTEIELELLAALVSGNGKINFWDESIALGVTKLQFEPACENFVAGLGVEVQTVGQ